MIDFKSLALETYRSKSKVNLDNEKHVCVMVWAAVASEVTKSRVVFIDEGLKVNSQVYLNMLRKKVLPWLTETFDNK